MDSYSTNFEIFEGVSQLNMRIQTSSNSFSSIMKGSLLLVVFIQTFIALSCEIQKEIIGDEK
jgi:hypothetical protein